jgi:hypothetical protein
MQYTELGELLLIGKAVKGLQLAKLAAYLLATPSFVVALWHGCLPSCLDGTVSWSWSPSRLMLLSSLMLFAFLAHHQHEQPWAQEELLLNEPTTAGLDRAETDHPCSHDILLMPCTKHSARHRLHKCRRCEWPCWLCWLTLGLFLCSVEAGNEGALAPMRKNVYPLHEYGPAREI